MPAQDKIDWSDCAAVESKLGHDVRTFVEMQWNPQLENGEILKAGEAEGSM